MLQRFAAGGRVDAGSPHGRYDKRYAHPDVLVAGGGPAGMAAALAAAAAGARVMLVEEEYELGGHLRWGDQARARSARPSCVTSVGDQEGIEVLVNSVVTGRYDDNWVAVLQRSHPQVVERLIKARAKTLVVAPGLIERPYVFEGNDLPGVMLTTAARRLVNLYAVKPGTRAVVFTANDEGDAAAADLQSAGVDIVRLVDARSGGRLVRARGEGAASRRSTSATDRRSSATCSSPPSGGRRRRCCINMAGDRPVYAERAARFVPGASLAAERARHRRASSATARRTSSSRTARAVGNAGGGRGRATGPAVDVPHLEPADHPALFQATTHGFVDFSEDVSSKDIYRGGEGGLRLGRAGQALHDRHDGPGPGQARDRQHRRRAGGGDRAHHRRDRHDRMAAAARADQPRCARRAASSSPSGTRRCSRGTRPTAPGRSSPGSGSAPSTTATPPPRCATCGRTSASST